MKMIYILNKCFDKVYITKPKTSRQANSEKYLVCKGFIGMNDEMEKCIFRMFNKMENLVGLNKNFVVDFEGLNFSNELYVKLNDMNGNFIENQIDHLRRVMDMIIDDELDEKIDEIKTEQVNNAVNWCLENNIKVNKESQFYIKYYKE